MQVNHKDGNTMNNNITNLEWVSNSENMFHLLDLINYCDLYLFPFNLFNFYLNE